MNREQMVEKAVEACVNFDCGPTCVTEVDHARAEMTAVFNAVLPQVTTVAELKTLPEDAVVLDVFGAPWELVGGPWRTTGIAGGFEADDVLNGRGGNLEGPRGPLTVVWTPEVTS